MFFVDALHDVRSQLNRTKTSSARHRQALETSPRQIFRRSNLSLSADSRHPPCIPRRQPRLKITDRPTLSLCQTRPSNLLVSEKSESSVAFYRARARERERNKKVPYLISGCHNLRLDAPVRRGAVAAKGGDGVDVAQLVAGIVDASNLAVRGQRRGGQARFARRRGADAEDVLCKEGREAGTEAGTEAGIVDVMFRSQAR